MTLADRLGVRARPARDRRPRRWRLGFKRFLPRTLFGRSLMIIVTPVLLMQAVAATYFYDEHWETITSRLASGVAGEIALVIEQMQEKTSPAERQVLFDQARRATTLSFAFRPGDRLGPQPALPALSVFTKYRDEMMWAMSVAVGPRFILLPDVGEEKVGIHVQLPDGVLEVVVPRRRMFSSTSQVFFLWTIGSGVVLFSIALVFMRNQIRPIGRLAAAAESFGKGRDVPNFRPQGSVEVRRAAQAFLVMRERLQRQITQRMEMLSGVSHDLRTPLTRMKLQLALLGDGPDIEELRADVAEMQRMIDAYLAFARGEGTEEPQPTDLAQLLEETVTAARREGADITMRAVEPMVLPLRPQAFRRCLGNLLSNARRHAGQIWVEAASRGGWAEVIVDDDGPGIPDHLTEEVFKAFYRIDTSRNLATGGTGLGLTIARDVARAHGGDIRLSRSPRGGLRCLVQLPR